MPSPGPLFIIGTGPMIGSHIARLFATHTFTHIALIARTRSNLTNSLIFIAAAAANLTIRTYAADATDHPALTAALDRAVADLGGPEVVVYNAARIKYGAFGEYSAEDVLLDFRIPNLGLYNTARVLLPGLRDLARQRPEAHPALFVTSSPLIYEPLAPVFSLSMAKAAQASLVKLLAAENEGVVHVALVTVGGPVAPEEEVNNPPNIATKFWELYQQEKGSWAFEMKCGW